MTRIDGTWAGSLSLVDAVDELLSRGVVLAGEATLSLAGVDLVYLGLNLVLASVGTLEQGRPLPPTPSPARGGGERPSQEPADQPSHPPLSGEGVGGRGLHGPGPGTYSGTRYPPATGDQPVVLPLTGLAASGASAAGEPPERGLARLALTLVEVLRQVMERQAVRRMDGGGLADDQIERMGRALMELEAKMAELRALFGLTDEDLNIDLGPLGRLLP